jgi:hypothetical protein
MEFEDIYSPESYGTNNDVYTVLLGKDTLSCTGCVDEQFYNRQYLLNSVCIRHLVLRHRFLVYANLLTDFTQLTTVEQNWNLTNIPNPDGDGAMWDSWMLPFSKLKAKHH